MVAILSLQRTRFGVSGQYVLVLFVYVWGKDWSGSLSHVQELVKNTHCLQTDLDRVHEASKELTGQMEAAAAAFVQSECRLLTRGCLQFEEAVKGKLGEVQVRNHNHL